MSYQIKMRSPFATLLLGAITGGIYYLYWLYKVNEEAAILANDENANPGLSLLAATIGAILIVPVIWTHVTTMSRVGNAVGDPFPTWLKVLTVATGFPYVFVVQGRLNKYGRKQRMIATSSNTVEVAAAA